MSRRVQVGHLIAASATASFRILEASALRAEASLGFSGLWGELGYRHTWNELLSTYVAVQYGQMGTIAKVRVKRGSTIIQTRLMLSAEYKNWQTAVATVVLPTLANLLLSRCGSMLAP